MAKNQAIILFTLALAILAIASFIMRTAEATNEVSKTKETQGDDGILNPMEMAISDAIQKNPSISVCQSGYFLTKGGTHDLAFQTHQYCANAGYSRSMIWMAYLYQNGLVEGGENPEMSALWDERAALAGNEVGMFNYGLDLLRGYGVKQNEGAGQEWIIRAADLGHSTSQTLIDANFDLRVVTPDSDEAKFSQIE